MPTPSVQISTCPDCGGAKNHGEGRRNRHNVVLVRECDIPEAARRRFERAIEMHAPVVLENLYKNVLPVYLAVSSKYRVLRAPKRPIMAVPFWVDTRNPFQWNVVRLTAWQFAEAKPLEEALVRWAKRYFLETKNDWILDLAVTTLQAWAWRSKSLRKTQLKWKRPRFKIESSFPKEDRQFTVRFAGWDIDRGEQWVDYERGTKAGLGKWLAQYKELMINRAKKRGCVILPVIRSPKAYCWLAMYQCLRQGTNDIWAKYPEGLGKTGNKSIQTAITRAAKQIGLKRLRPKNQRRRAGSAAME